MIAHHELPESAFASLASGVAGPGVVQYLKEAQRSKHVMLLTRSPRQRTVRARAGRLPGRLRALTRVQQAAGGGRLAAGPAAPRRLDPRRPDPPGAGNSSDFAYLACAAAAAAVRRASPSSWTSRFGTAGSCCRASDRWTSERGGLGQAALRRRAGEAAGGDFVADGPAAGPGRRLGPASAAAGPGRPAVRAVGGGPAWDVLLETADPYLDRYPLPMRLRPATGGATLAGAIRPPGRSWPISTAGRPSRSRRRVSVIVPLTPRSDTDLISATAPAAFGAIATSWPPIR